MSRLSSQLATVTAQAMNLMGERGTYTPLGGIPLPPLIVRRCDPESVAVDLPGVTITAENQWFLIETDALQIPGYSSPHWKVLPVPHQPVPGDQIILRDGYYQVMMPPGTENCWYWADPNHIRRYVFARLITTPPPAEVVNNAGRRI